MSGPGSPVSEENRDEDVKDKPENPDPPQTAEKAIEDSKKAEASAAADADEESDEEAVDSADPAAIARRVAALGEEDEIEKMAREEERKLAERRAAGKKGKKKKGGLEVAASKKLAKIGTRAEPKRNVAVAADADPLIEKTAKLTDWAKQNQKLVQWVGALLAIGLIGLAGFMWWQNDRETKASVLLSKAIESQRAHIGEPPKEDDEKEDEGPYFKTYEERRDATIKKYKEVEEKYAGTGAAILARLAEGSLLLDKRDADGAAAAFTEVKNSALGAADKEVKGRALEGLGFAYELKALAAAPGSPDANKFYDQALETYRDLENNVDVKGFKELAMFHQARVLENKGDKDKAKEVLLKLKERFDKPDDAPSSAVPMGPQFPYLREVAMDRLREIDPSAAPKIQGMPGGGAQVLPPHIRKMLEDQAKKQQQGGGGH